MKNSRRMKWVGPAILVLMLSITVSSCGILEDPLRDAPQPALGGSVRMALENQKLNPEPTPPVPVEGLDGEYAEGVVSKYRIIEDKSGQKSKSRKKIGLTSLQKEDK